MRINYNVTGSRRKELVEVIGETIGFKPIYMKVPTCEYKVGEITVSKTGELIWEENTDDATIRKIVKALSDVGFNGSGEENILIEAEEEALPEQVGLTVEIPFNKVNVGNLMKILDAKGELIKKALGIVDIRIEIIEDRVTFPWFTEVEPESAMVYTNFIAALCRMSKEAKRVTVTPREDPNEKYAFRCFLLRLGFIGTEYKKDRKILLKNLTGCAAYRDKPNAN